MLNNNVELEPSVTVPAGKMTSLNRRTLYRRGFDVLDANVRPTFAKRRQNNVDITLSALSTYFQANFDVVCPLGHSSLQLITMNTVYSKTFLTP